MAGPRGGGGSACLARAAGGLGVPGPRGGGLGVPGPRGAGGSACLARAARGSACPTRAARGVTADPLPIDTAGRLGACPVSRYRAPSVGTVPPQSAACPVSR
ncbi:hypothetical protein SAMN05216483_2418 [Streptomyces sp. 2131.1]|nr:hypothetical protein SAMN05216483_2418 [Streptomyces sp. 2131.1]